MKFEKITLHKYIPFVHSGKTTVSIDIKENVIPIIGNNGSGKSSLLRAMSVFPPISSDFEDEGYKEILLSHNDSDYILKSEFQKSKGVHYFFKDGENLNLSFNSTAQTSLCESHFGMSNLIRDITNGELNISKITRAARKDILLSCYPSDLSFVLTYHKKISSEIRAIKSNIKMMNIRLQEVSDKLMEEEEYKSLVKLDAELTEFQSNIDSWIYRLEQDIETLKKHSHYNEGLRVNADDLVQFKENVSSTNTSVKEKLRSLPDTIIFDNSNPSSKVEILNSTMMMREDRLTEFKTSIAKLVKEIDEYEELANDDIDAEIKKTKAEITHIENLVNTAKLDINLPVINLPDNHNELIITLNEHITAIHSCDGKIIPSDKVSILESDLRSVNMEGTSIASDVSRLDNQISALNKKISIQKTLSYNSNCQMQCQLKSNYDDSIKALEDERNELEATKSNYDSKLKELRVKKEKLIGVISTPRQMMKSIVHMENFYRSYSWCDTIAPSLEEFITLLNTNASNVYNTISRIFANTRTALTVEQLQKDLSSVEYRLKVLVENKLPTKQLISKGLIDKKASLSKLQDQFKQLDDNQRVVKQDLNRYTTLSKTRSEFKEFYNSSINKVNSYLVTAKIVDLTNLIDNLRHYKKAATSRQSELGTILKEQSHLRIRLTEEIEPSLKKLHVEMDELVLIETALSPNSGIPHIYMTRFVNSVFRTANEYIEMVWNYDLKFKELSEDRVLDFNFPIMLHDKSGVKDAAMCSKGEQEMLNLAFTLALCVHMGVGNKFPIKLDEVDSGFSAAHRDSLLGLLSMLMRQGLIRQLVLVNHFSSLFTSFANSQVICLNPDGIAVPSVYNEGVAIC